MSSPWIPQIDSRLCSACGLCVQHCPQQALVIIGPSACVSDAADCDYCAVCEGVCPVGAIQLPYQIRFQTRNP